MLTPYSAKIRIAKAAIAPMARPRPLASRVTLHSQAAIASATKAANSTATPLAPASCASTQVSHAAAPYMGKARNCFSRSIQVPGLGMKDKARGKSARIRNGRAKPKPSDRKISNADTVLCVRAKPSAAAMKGAVQGAATATASTPVKNAPTAPERDARLSPTVTEPNSNTPERFKPTAKISSEKPATAIGSCNWKPQPTALPPWRSATITSPNSRKLSTAPVV